MMHSAVMVEKELLEQIFIPQYSVLPCTGLSNLRMHTVYLLNQMSVIFIVVYSFCINFDSRRVS